MDLVDLEEEDSKEYEDIRAKLAKVINKGDVVIYEGKEALVTKEVEEE